MCDMGYVICDVWCVICDGLAVFIPLIKYIKINTVSYHLPSIALLNWSNFQCIPFKVWLDSSLRITNFLPDSCQILGFQSLEDFAYSLLALILWSQVFFCQLFLHFLLKKNHRNIDYFSHFDCLGWEKYHIRQNNRPSTD